MTQIKNLKDLEIDIARNDGRQKNQLREIKITPNYIKNATGSVLIEAGNTRVVCVVSIENKIPRWMMQQGLRKQGWITAEYNMLPYAGGQRKMRESTMGKVSGRTQEIQRLIGRSFRAVVDLKALGERTIWIDCDVLEADGGTRTASITGAYVALSLAIKKLQKKNMIKGNPLKQQVSAISVGIVDGKALLDLDYSEDFAAEVDFNVVMTDSGEFIEVQGTAEEKPFTGDQLSQMLKLAEKGCKEIFELQKSVICNP